MKLHTSLSNTQVVLCLDKAKQAGRVSADIQFVQFAYENSRSRPRGYLIQLGTYDKWTRLDGKPRRYKNSGDSGAGSLYAATYDEWGWFIAEVFAADPDAIFGEYRSREDLNVRRRPRPGRRIPPGRSGAAGKRAACAGPASSWRLSVQPAAAFPRTRLPAEDKFITSVMEQPVPDDLPPLTYAYLASLAVMPDPLHEDVSRGDVHSRDGAYYNSPLGPDVGLHIHAAGDKWYETEPEKPVHVIINGSKRAMVYPSGLVNHVRDNMGPGWRGELLDDDLWGPDGKTIVTWMDRLLAANKEITMDDVQAGRDSA